MFADNPAGSEEEPTADVSNGRTYLLHEADRNLTDETDALTEDRPKGILLLDRVALLPNLARALLAVARNQGAAGVDGVSTMEVVEAAPDLLPKIRHALITGTYQPGDLRRV